MEDIGGVTVRMWEGTWSKETGDWVRGRKETRDDRGHLFLFVIMDHGGPDETIDAYVYGKKVVENEEEKNIALTEGEKERLRLPKIEYKNA